MCRAGSACLADDIIDTAGTIQKAAQALKDNGASRVLASAVHGVLSGPAMTRIEAAPIDKLIITNTIPLDGDRAGAGQDRRAVGGAPAGAGHPEHPRRNIRIEAVRLAADASGGGSRPGQE